MPNSCCLNLFTYGTLMDRDELAFRLVVPTSEVERRLRTKVAEATGFRRVYNKQVAEEGGAVLNLEFDKAGTVVGILYMDITHQELGMLDASYPHHLPRKPLEVMVEGEKVPALAYMAKADAGVQVAAAYEQRLLDLIRRLGEPIQANFLHYTFRADGSPCYRPPDPPATEAPAAAPAAPPGG
jgi:plasmid stabilization system protein ParE